ncbi:MAG: hypothetical protein AMXMBFR64_25230 [Myxococcales bacterium]
MKRRPAREISVFNLSMLDVICSALGAVLILYLIVALQQKKDGKDLRECLVELKECETEPCATRCPCDRECPCAQRCPCPDIDCARQCPCAANCPCDSNCPCDQYCTCPNPPPPFVVVLVRWRGAGVDIDLHVRNPTGGECSFRSLTGCATAGNAEVVNDYQQGGVDETFIGRRIPTDDQWWTVSYNYYTGNAGVTVEGWAYYPDGTHVIAPVNLGPMDRGKKRAVLRFKANRDGRVQFSVP